MPEGQGNTSLVVFVRGQNYGAEITADKTVSRKKKMIVDAFVMVVRVHQGRAPALYMACMCVYVCVHELAACICHLEKNCGFQKGSRYRTLSLMHSSTSHCGWSSINAD